MQQAIRPINGPIHSKITIPGSKSLTHRALLLSALADGVSELSEIRISQDLRTFAKALLQLGIVTQVDEKERSCIVAGTNGKFLKKQATLWCGNSKTTTRFLLATCAATSGVFYFDGSANLRKKPIKPLLHVLINQGAQLIPNDATRLPFTLIGTESLEGGEITLDNEITSEIVSALLMISPYARSPFNFNVSDLANQSCINMTCALMAEYGVLVHRIHQGQFMVPVPQRYQAKDYTIEPDFSIAAYFFAAAAVTGGEITIQPVNLSQSKQADVNFLTVLEKMGCRIHESPTGLSLNGPSELQGIEISMRSFSDSFFALSAIAPFSRSPIRISHLGTIKQKELARINRMKTQLIKLGIHVEAGDDWIKIFPGTPKPGVINTYGDPRMAMAFSVIGSKIPGIVINDAECITKIFPDFYTLWDRLSEQVNISAW